MSFKLFFRLIIISGILSLIAIGTLVYHIQKESTYLETIQEQKNQSMLLTYELRQSSDDLTKFARTYAVTQNTDYEKMYWDIINIRNGKIPRPKNYHRIYWDFIINYKDKPQSNGALISLKELMKKAGIKNEEFQLLDQAQKNSDGLIKIETIAMNAIKGLYADSNGVYNIKKEPNQKMAIELLHSKEYHTEKAKIMKPINQFISKLEERTTNEVNNAVNTSQNYVYLLVLVILIISSFYLILFYINRNKIKNLYLFKDGLLNFFKYVNNETKYTGTIDIKEVGELEEMVSLVNENIIKTKENIELDNNVINDAISMLSSFEKGDLSKRVTADCNTQTLKNLTKLLNKTAQNLENKVNIILSVLKEYTNFNYIKRIDEKGLESHILNLAKGINTLANSTAESLKENKSHGSTLKNSSEMLLKNIDILNTNTNSTAAALEQTAAAIEEINNNANQNLNNVLKMSENASTLTEAANKGKSLATQTAESMEKINEEVTSINEAITIIDQIAFQTNILSLNAAVEAATAGEAGKGFAVVAQEVRNLANRSADAARDIKSIVELAAQKAEEGKNIAGTMVTDYNKLNENITSNIKIIKEVEYANREQGKGIEQITDSVNSLDAKTQQNASIATQTHEIATKTDSVAKQIEANANKSKF